MQLLRSNTPGQGSGKVALPLVPPMDWRMPATVTTSAGISDSQAALAAAQETSASKSRPGFTVAIGQTEYVEYTMEQSGVIILSWLGQNVGTASVSLNGVDQAFSPRVPAGGTVGGTSAGGRRQFAKLTVSAGDTVRLTIAAGAAARIIIPLVHKIPESGPWEAYIIFGASRESDGFGCKLIEDDIIAQDATRDPIMFTHAFSGKDLAEIAGIVVSDAPLYVGVAYYAILGNIMGNTISDDRPYGPGQKAPNEADIATIFGAIQPHFVTAMNSTSYRQYNSPDVRPDDQVNGSLPYNDNIVFPAMSAALPDMYDPVLQRARIDSYLAELRWRASLTDTVHGAYPEERAEWIRTFFTRVKTGTWVGIPSFAELLVSTAESNATNKTAALLAYTEATFAMLALASTAEKATMEARLTAIHPTVLFFEAVRHVDAAVSAASTVARDAAQDALDTAETAGFVDMASPNTIAEQQARLDAIVIISYDQIINIGFGANTAVTGWNRSNSNSTGAILSNMLDDQGNATGVGVTVTISATSNGTNSGLVSAIPGIPDTIVAAAWNRGGNMAHKYTGLDPAKTYDIFLMPCRSGTDSDRVVTYSVNGVTQSPSINPIPNVSEHVKAENISPDGSGEISITITRTSGSFAHHTVTRIMRRA